MSSEYCHETKRDCTAGARHWAVLAGLALLSIFHVAGTVRGQAAGNTGPAVEPAKVSPWADYRYAPDALREIGLESDSAWTLDIGTGPPRPIKVPGGGWNSNLQHPMLLPANMHGDNQPDVLRDYVVYERKIQIPRVVDNQVTKIIFGAVNFGADVFIDNKLVDATTYTGPMVPFAVDISRQAKPGNQYVLRVKAYQKQHNPMGYDCTGWWDAEGSRNTKFPYGISGYVRLAVYPPVHIQDVFVKPSVSKSNLTADVWIRNASGEKQAVSLKAKLSAWKGGQWDYPPIPDVACTLAPGETRRLTLGPIPWTLGPKSFWWPNIPFREDYAATLHWLNLSVQAGGKTVHERRERFGFVEHAEGPYYYMVNGVRVNGLGDSVAFGQLHEYDCWTNMACFQPPSGKSKGCPGTWNRFQRIGFNTVRTHLSVPSRYMLETADEAGFMLIPEVGGKWVDTGDFGARYERQVRGIIRTCRNHPSVARYSLGNEMYGLKKDEREGMIDAASEADATRPYIFDGLDIADAARQRVDGTKGGHALVMDHYLAAKKGDYLRGMGEHYWVIDGMGQYASLVLHLRLLDYAYTAPWCWVSYWPNFLEGTSFSRYPMRFNNLSDYGDPWHGVIGNYADRRDGIDGWGSPMVQTVQRALNPFLIIDKGLLELNPNIKETSSDHKVGWPYAVPAYSAGQKIAREVEVFNGSLFGNTMELRWHTRWDTPNGPDVAAGEVGAFAVEPGFHTAQTVAFTAPNPTAKQRKLYLVIEALKDGQCVYTEDRVYFTIDGTREVR